jgi:XTP/dITP diphosphohydrolase
MMDFCIFASGFFTKLKPHIKSDIMKIVFATGNVGKLREASEILGEGFELVSLEQVGILEDIPETGNTLRANSLQKAQHLYEKLGCNCFADDTGLEVDALGGAPGVYTARYAGDDKDFNKNMDKVLYELGVIEGEARMAESVGLKVKKVSRRARFKSVVTLIIDGKIQIFEGALEGVIARQKSGNGGFGYDPIFIADEFPGLTLADISEEEKNAISHRGKALRAMAQWLQEHV